MNETLTFSFFDCVVPTGDCVAVPAAAGDCARAVSIIPASTPAEKCFTLTVSNSSPYTYLEDVSSERFHSFRLSVTSPAFICRSVHVRRYALPQHGKQQPSVRPVARFIANTGRFLRC